MYFVSIGDEVTLDEVKHFAKVQVQFEGGVYPAWEMDNTDGEVGELATLTYREHNPDDDVFYTAQAKCLKVSEDAWAVIDMARGEKQLADYDKHRKEYMIACIQDVMNKHESGLDAEEVLEQFNII